MNQQPVGMVRPSAVLGERRDAIRQQLAEHGVVSAGVFGSVARGEDTTDSDLDLIVEFGPGHARDVIGLEAALLEILGTTVDVVDARAVWRRAKATGLGYSILRETVPL